MLTFIKCFFMIVGIVVVVTSLVSYILLEKERRELEKNDSNPLK
jgi:hypothetical protein